METTAREILRLRLAGQFIAPAGSADVAATVRHMVALQAQDFGGSLWAVGLRARGSTRTAVLAAMGRGEIVRTLPMRGTLHLVASEDLRWMLSLTAARTLRSAATRFRNLGLDRSTLDAAELIVRNSLAGGGSLARDEFMALLSANHIAPDGQRGYHVIFYLCQMGLVCWGPPRGTQQALVLVDEWIPPAPDRDRQELLESFALRYFASHGPATERDFAWWTKLTLADVRAAISELGDRLVSLSHGGADYLIPAATIEAAGRGRLGSSVHALPGFDEYLLGYQDRSIALADEHFLSIVPGNNGIFLPMVVAQGEIVGTWRRVAKSKEAAIAPEHFAEADPALEAGFRRAAGDYARFTLG
jgi:hypothetical protein